MRFLLLVRFVTAVGCVFILARETVRLQDPCGEGSWWTIGVVGAVLVTETLNAVADLRQR